MGDEGKQCWNPAHAGSFVGPLWFAAWLFTIAFLKLGFWKAVLGLLLWPYYLGVFFRS